MTERELKGPHLDDACTPADHEIVGYACRRCGLSTSTLVDWLDQELPPDAYVK